MKRILRSWFLLAFICLYGNTAMTQTCNLTLNAVATPSICKATGTIQATVTGGSGNYNFTLTGGTVNTVTSSALINGLPSGTYTLSVKDLSSGCTKQLTGIVVGGTYQDPRFTLSVTDVSCLNAANGSVTVTNVQYGKGPFTYTIVAPSTSAVGTTSSTGVFNNLPAGTYYVSLTDSCGGIQTRNVTVSDFNWWIDSRSVTKTGCDSADAVITLKDSRGNFNTGASVFNGFTYGVIRATGDTSWYNSRSFRFYKGNLRSVTLVARDACGNRKTIGWTDTNRPAVAANLTYSNQDCSGFTATVTGQTNLTNPQYCIFNSANVQLSCNTTGVFTALPYGSYCVRITDLCYDTVINRCFTVAAPVKSVAASVSISNLACAGFTATITGQTNLTNPQYCIFDNNNVQLSCNTTGVFNNLPYGSYCIRVTNGCTDTTITRCFTRNRPVPALGAGVGISAQACGSFTATIGGQSNINNGNYCIYDNLGNLISCNTTGVFTGLAYGSYCIKLTNNAACYDTVITRCFTALPPVPAVGNTIGISAQGCSDFTATVSGQSNLNNPQYCIYTPANVLVACNTTGVFTGLPYGSYCIRVTNNPLCYDTVINRCFTVNKPLPSVGANVSISGRTCSGFNAAVSGQSNINNPVYELYDNANQLVASNKSGSFSNLAYGSYCIRVINDAACYDTTIQRCFTVNPAAFNLNASATASCTIGTSNISISWSATNNPYKVTLYSPGNVFYAEYNGNATSATFSNVPGLPSGFKYKAVITDQCGRKDSVEIAPFASQLNKSISVNAKCPSGQWLNGAGDLVVFSQYNNGSVTPKIVKKNGAAVSINFAYNSGNNYTFTNMEPAQYIIEYTLQNCSNKVNDTFNLQPYAYPELGQSAVYQCNNNSFGVNAVVSGGLAPYNYQIIGSIPESPAINTNNQNSPLFNINNGTHYSLIRLRATDACGNATINDASILPLANTVVSSNSNCFYNNITLQAEVIPNATYTWYKRVWPNDSVLVSTGTSMNFPYLMPGDTGVYISKASINNGCLTRLSYFNLNGSCGGSILSVNGVTFSAKLDKDQGQLTWSTRAGVVADQFVVEKSTDGGRFEPLAQLNAVAARQGSGQSYYFTDAQLQAGKNLYRIRIKAAGKQDRFTEIQTLVYTASGSITVWPNPVQNQMELRFGAALQGQFQLNLRAADGRLVLSRAVQVKSGESIRLDRPASIIPGVYYLQVQQAGATGVPQVYKLLFK